MEDAKKYLASLGLQSVEEHDYVPWVWYRYKRHVQIYFNYLRGVSERREAGGALKDHFKHASVTRSPREYLACKHLEA